MLLKLNLLSPGQKREVHSQKITLLLKQFTLACLGGVLLATAGAAAMKAVLTNNLQKITAADYRTGQTINIRINQTNALLDALHDVRTGYRAWSPLLMSLAAQTPAGVKFSALEIDAGKKTLSLRGVAQTREELLTLKKNLSKTKLVTTINLPVQNLAQKENAQFVMSATLP